ncbi:MAG TPA: SMI1/KNR4 family protein [Sphingopyxis sp.]|nr:SMI1/KNR4 family protein [Sphingopyxis sp.]
MTKIFHDFDLLGFWEDSDWADKEYVEPVPTQEIIQSVEEELGYKLPAAYIELMQSQNGGCPVNTCHRTAVRTSWADDHVAITDFKGIGRTQIWSLCGQLGSRQSTDEWGYPDIGIYFGDCPSAGHDMLCLDYRECGPSGEPKVVHIDQECDYRITHVADSFEAFVRGLEHEDSFDVETGGDPQPPSNIVSAWINPDFAKKHGVEEEETGVSKQPWWAFWRRDK